MPLTSPNAHPSWCLRSSCEDDGSMLVHREVPELVIPADDPENLVAVALIEGDEYGPHGLEHFEPEVTVSIRHEMSHMALGEAEQLRDLLAAAIKRATS